MIKKAIWGTLLMCVAFSTLLISTGQAQEYPSKPITLIVGFAAGGTTDLSARKLAELVSKYLNNQPVVVEAKPGGAGTVGAVVLSQAKPDGYTISAVAYSPLVLIPHMRKISYDTKKDFEYIMQYGEYPESFCVRKEHPANSWKEWVEWARNNQDKATYTTSGPGSGQHVFMQEILQIEKLNLAHIPFGGGSEAVIKLLGGHVSAMLGSEVVAHVKTGELKPLAVENPEGLSYISQVPTFRQLGYTQVQAPLWAGIAAPGKTPAPILKRLEEAFIKAANEPAFQEMMKKIEMIVKIRDSATFTKTVETEYDYYGPVLKSLGIRAQ
jgi:tripartite-type tricarboxylate transporter receptor subunit TctC